MVNEFQDVADFVVVYIKEAHPLDEWFFEKQVYNLNQPVTNEERFAAARNLLEFGLNCPLLVDPIDNKANLLYNAYPEKLYIIKEGKVAFHTKQGPVYYDVKLVDDWLQKEFPSHKGTKSD